jgi:FAD/FMN-containing dehydrogenase
MGPVVGRVFNMAYYRRHVPRVKRGIVHPQKFFYPLDAIESWNRLYGPRGFTQYQCVLPEEAGRGAARRFLEVLTGKRAASFLCVIKDCGAEGRGMLSFPKPGISIAVDIPVRDDIQDVVDSLNEFVIEMGGRIYLTKDAFTRPEHFRRMEPRLQAWQRVRRQWDPDLRLRSAQSIRVLGDPP